MDYARLVTDPPLISPPIFFLLFLFDMWRPTPLVIEKHFLQYPLLDMKNDVLPYPRHNFKQSNLRYVRRSTTEWFSSFKTSLKCILKKSTLSREQKHFLSTRQPGAQKSKIVFKPNPYCLPKCVIFLKYLRCDKTPSIAFLKDFILDCGTELFPLNAGILFHSVKQTYFHLNYHEWDKHQ